MEETEKDWKLKLRSGELATPFKHYTIIGEGVVEEFIEEFECPPGNAFMGVKIWAESFEQSADVYQSIAGQIGFKIKSELKIYETEPEKPPRDKPYGYDIVFTSFP